MTDCEGKFFSPPYWQFYIFYSITHWNVPWNSTQDPEVKRVLILILVKLVSKITVSPHIFFEHAQKCIQAKKIQRYLISIKGENVEITKNKLHKIAVGGQYSCQRWSCSTFFFLFSFTYRPNTTKPETTNQYSLTVTRY